MNQIIDITPIASATALENLFLVDNNIISGVAELTTLTNAVYIDLSFNEMIPPLDVEALDNALGPGIVVWDF